MNLTRRVFVAGALGGLATPALAGSRLHEVAIRDFAYSPDRLEVRAGDCIRFTNYDLTPHTATATDGSWDSGRLNRNESTELEVTPDWSADYVCAFHPQMKATLVIAGQ